MTTPSKTDRTGGRPAAFGFRTGPARRKALLCIAFREFGRMYAEVFPDIQLHPVDLREKTRHRSVIVFGIRFHVTKVRDLPLEFRDSVKRNIEFLIVCNH